MGPSRGATVGAMRTEPVAAGIAARSVQIAVAFVVQAVILFVGAGRVGWLWAWVYLGVCTVAVAVNATVLMRHSPDLVAERGRIGQMRAWDKVIGISWSVAAYVALPLVAALDARFGWTSGMATGWQLAGVAALAATFGLAGWAMSANAFFSTAVRIQSERGHAVCRSGPYRYVRHPGYVAFILQSFATAILLGSLWALIPAALAGAATAARTVLEDRMLRAELVGYREYAEAVRWRLVPGLW